MWFKNMQVLQFKSAVTLTAQQLLEALSRKPFEPCSDFTAQSAGWVSPTGEEGGSLVHEIGDFMMFCLKMEEKIIPGTVVREKLAEKLSEISEITGRTPKGPEKERLKDEVFQSLLPRALARSAKLYAYIDRREGFLIMDTASPNKAEAFFKLLHKQLGSLALSIPEVMPPEQLMTRWLQQLTLPEGFAFADACVLVNPEDKGIVRCKGKDLTSDNIQSFLEEGCQVTQMAFVWRDQVQFTLKQDLSVTGLRFLEGVKGQLGEIEAESKAAAFDADFVIMTQTLRELLRDLMTILSAEQNRLVMPAPIEALEAVEVL